MRLGPIALKIRVHFGSIREHRIGNRVAGAAELASAYKGTLLEEAAFVIQLADDARPNDMDQGVNQRITERFGVVIALKNDGSDADKLGLGAYDSIHNLRAQLFKALLGWQMEGMESLVSYRGGRLLSISRAWLWYQFEFEAYLRVDNDDGVDMGDLADFDSVYADYILAPSVNLPSGYPALSPNMQQFVNLDADPEAGEYGLSFGSGFDFYPDEVTRSSKWR